MGLMGLGGSIKISEENLEQKKSRQVILSGLFHEREWVNERGWTAVSKK